MSNLRVTSSEVATATWWDLIPSNVHSNGGPPLCQRLCNLMRLADMSSPWAIHVCGPTPEAPRISPTRVTLRSWWHCAHENIGMFPLVVKTWLNVEELSKSCQTCQANKSAPSTAPLHPWVRPEHLWQPVHIVFARPFKGRVFLLLVDAQTIWPEIHTCHSQPLIPILRY